MQNRNYYTLIISLLGAIKLILNSFGINLITDQMANDLANAIATILTVVGVVMTHLKKNPKIDFRAFVSGLFKKKSQKAPTPSIKNQPASVDVISKTIQTASPGPEVDSTVVTSAPSEQTEEPDPSGPATPTAPTNSVQQ